MPQNRILYNVQDVFVGPCKPDYVLVFPDRQLMQRLPRVTSFAFGTEFNRSEVSELGSYGIATRHISTYPDVTFGFDYIQSNVLNEVNVGLGVNYNLSGVPIHSNNYGISLISGFIKKDRTEDARNFYLAINQSGIDSHANYSGIFGTGFGNDQLIDPNCPSYHLISFLNSYLTNLEYKAAVGEFPNVHMDFVADSIHYNTSGSGVPVLEMDPVLGSGIPTIHKVVLPKTFSGDRQPTALRPGDITVTISSTGYTNITDWGMDFNDVRIQSYDIKVPLNRDKVEFIGLQAPADRPIVFPIVFDLTINAIPGDLGSGNLTNLFRKDFSYDISIKTNTSVASPLQGQSVAFLCDCRSVRLNSINYEGSISDPKNISMSFKGQIDPSDFSRGLFVSGITPLPQSLYQELYTDTNEGIVTDLGEPIIVDGFLLSPLTF